MAPTGPYGRTILQCVDISSDNQESHRRLSPNAARRVFIDGLSGAEGAATDPLTGDFLFSTFGSGNKVLAVRGFAVPSTTATATTTTATTTSTTSTTQPSGCSLEAPLDQIDGLECVITRMHSSLGAPPAPECTGSGRCTCNNRSTLTRITTAIESAKAATTPRSCRRKMKDVRRLAGVTGRHLRTQAKRNCLAAGERREQLLALGAALAARAKAVQQGSYCATR